MVRGRNVTAEIEAPDVVEIPRRGNAQVVVRISLHNDGEDDFIAHAESEDDSHFWHVLDENQREIVRHKGKAGGVKKVKGVHSYRTTTVAGGHGVHGERTLSLTRRMLEEGQTYTIRGEVYGHPAETTFVAVKAAPKPPKKTKKPKKTKPRGKTGAKKKKKKAPAKRKAAPKKKTAARKRVARKGRKKVVRGRKKKK